MRRKHVGAAAVLVVAYCGAVAPPAAGQSVSRTLSVQQKLVKDAGAVSAPAAAGGLSVVAWVDRPDYTYARGEDVRVFVETNKDAYVTLLNVDPAGGTTILFPNRYQPDNFVRAGRAIQVPDPSSGARITVTGSVGAELLKVIASTRPVDPFEAADLSEAGPFRMVNARAADVATGLTRSLKVIDATPAASVPPAARPPSAVAAPSPVAFGGSGLQGGANEWALCHQTLATIEAPAARTRSLQVVRTSDRPSTATCDEAIR